MTMKDSAIEKLPRPTGWRILVLPYKRNEKTKGGIILTDQSLEESQVASSIGLVLKIGPDAYKEKEKFIIKQVNLASSKPYVFRGFHYQVQKPQAKEDSIYFECKKLTPKLKTQARLVWKRFIK